MNQIKTILGNLGLTETEMDIYLAGLSYDSIGVREIEKITRVKRTTIYHAMNTLMQKGLAAKKETGIKLVFQMTPPENLKKIVEREIKLLEERKKEMDTIIPLLKDRKKKKEEIFKVSHFEGIEGIKLVVEEALYCRSREWSIIAPRKNFFSEFDPAYSCYFLKTRKENGIKARSLWEFTPNSRALSSEEQRERNPRYLPKIMHGKFQSVVIIFDDKVAFISSIKNLSAVLIQSGEVHETMFAIFSGLWINSEKI